MQHSLISSYRFALTVFEELVHNNIDNVRYMFIYGGIESMDLFIHGGIESTDLFIHSTL